jgi:hypothetical protein
MFDGQNLPDDFAVALANATGDDLAETRRAVNRYLNHYEHLAAGVNADVLDFEILRRVSQRSLIAIYRKFEPYVIARRVATGRLQMFCEFQQLAERLASESTPG